MSPRILCVDDEPQVLAGLRRTLREHYDVLTAEGGEAGLAALEQHDDLAVVVSDMRMPGMDGASFLAKVREQWPDTTRLLLTGQADMDAAIAAVNEGQIFRFLTKPCPPDVLLPALDQAVRQHQLVRAERELTEGTLRGAIGVLADVLSMVSPSTHKTARRVARDVVGMAEELHLSDAWQFEVAALLSGLGSVALPTDLAERHARGDRLNDAERAAIADVPRAGAALLERIPRMDEVAEMIRLQGSPLQPAWVHEPWPRVGIGASLLRAAIAVEQERRGGANDVEANQRVLERGHVHHPAVMEALARRTPAEAVAEGGDSTRRVRLRELRAGMILREDLVDGDGTLLISAGHEVSEPLLARIERLAELRDLPADLEVST